MKQWLDRSGEQGVRKARSTMYPYSSKMSEHYGNHCTHRTIRIEIWTQPPILALKKPPIKTPKMVRDFIEGFIGGFSRPNTGDVL